MVSFSLYEVRTVGHSFLWILLSLTPLSLKYSFLLVSEAVHLPVFSLSFLGGTSPPLVILIIFLSVLFLRDPLEDLSDFLHTHQTLMIVFMLAIPKLVSSR